MKQNDAVLATVEAHLSVGRPILHVQRLHSVVPRLVFRRFNIRLVVRLLAYEIGPEHNMVSSLVILSEKRPPAD